MQYHKVLTFKVCLNPRISWENPNYPQFRSVFIDKKKLRKLHLLFVWFNIFVLKIFFPDKGSSQQPLVSLLWRQLLNITTPLNKQTAFFVNTDIRNHSNYYFDNRYQKTNTLHFATGLISLQCLQKQFLNIAFLTVVKYTFYDRKFQINN